MKVSSTKYFIGIAILAILMSILLIWFQMRRAESSVQSSAVELSDRVIATLESRVATDPDNAQYAVALSDAYLQKIRETGDASLYEKIESTLDVFTEQSPKDPQILAKRAEVANGRHDFKKGLEYISEAIKLDTRVAAFYGIKSDAETELGRYDDAANSLQMMTDLKPNFNAYSRITYQRELHGDFEGAVEALAAAISAGSAHPENIAWAYIESGKLLIPTDRAQAVQYFTKALDLVPKYAPALEGLGRVAYANGEKDKARDYFTQAFASVPIAEYATALGNFYAVEGDANKAQQHYTLADIAYKDSKGVNVDLEYALFLADHGDPAEALRRAEAAYSARPSIYSADAYSWALFKNNRIDEAAKYNKEALRLGENDSNMLFHAWMIARTMGQAREAESYHKAARARDQYTTLPYSKVLHE